MSHSNLDRKRLAAAKLIAEKVRLNPSLFREVGERLKEWRKTIDQRSMSYIDGWDEVYAQGLEKCLDFLVSDTDKGTAFRQVNPFALLLVDEERTEFNRKWNIENFGNAGVFGEARKVKPIDLKDLSHVVRVINIMEEQLPNVFLIGEQTTLFGNKKRCISNIALFGTHDMEKINIPYWNTFGKDSPFHNVFGYYLKLMDMNTLSFPSGWEKRVKKVTLENNILNVLSEEDSISDLTVLQ